MNEYFVHDSTAGTDARLMHMRSLYGCKYYVMYWLTLEWLYQNADAVGEYDIKSLSFYMHVDEKETKEFLDYCIEKQLFINDKTGLYSLRLKEQKEKQIDKSDKARANALRRHSKRICDGNASRVEKSRVEKSKNIPAEPKVEKNLQSHLYPYAMFCMVFGVECNSSEEWSVLIRRNAKLSKELSVLPDEIVAKAIVVAEENWVRGGKKYEIRLETVQKAFEDVALGFPANLSGRLQEVLDAFPARKNIILLPKSHD